ncbi:MAG: 3-oxoacyl-[acyl-carrier-protein] reductase [Bdellovibrionaceae bacterium]|nr:3-oxoacyl-[acyl-carrier-protein] reductase [Pseudobdellovibrionaceae bacterium]NUM58196.1 3-oxoacyl-[acyl-carrier-protein] reductase [Pseudobdellovibrionaceae bacterium]
MLLSGKKIIVTGGSRGIGASIVQVLADSGAQVAFTYSSNEDSAKKVLSGLRGEGHFTVQMDISNENSINKGLELIFSKWPEIDGLVNNAGITKDGLLLRMKSEDFENVINTNLKGAFLLTKALSKVMMKSRKGSIVNITSVIGQTGNAGQSNYAASKAGLIGFSKSVAQELAARNIRVNCVAPGFIATEMTHVLNDEVKAKIMDKIPLQRMGDAKDVANAVKFLLSDESSYITGHTLSINGGMFME